MLRDARSLTLGDRIDLQYLTAKGWFPIILSGTDLDAPIRAIPREERVILLVIRDLAAQYNRRIANPGSAEDTRMFNW